MRNYILFLGFLVLGAGAFADYDSQGTYIELRKEMYTLVVCENNVAELNNKLIAASGPACNDLKQKVDLLGVNAYYQELRNRRDGQKPELTKEEKEELEAWQRAAKRTVEDWKLECSESVRSSLMDSPNQRTIFILKKPFRVSRPSAWNGQICVTVTKSETSS